MKIGKWSFNQVKEYSPTGLVYEDEILQLLEQISILRIKVIDCVQVDGVNRKRYSITILRSQADLFVPLIKTIISAKRER